MITRRLIRPSLSRIKDAPDRGDAAEGQEPAAPREEFNDAPPRETAGRDYDNRPARPPAYGRDADAGRGDYDAPRERPARPYDRGGYNNDRPAYNNDRGGYNNDRPGYGDKPGFKRPFRPGFKPGGFGGPGGPGGFKKKFAPSSETNAENYYYKKQMEKKTPIIAVMMDGETINGWIEWYDRDVLKINRDDKPNLLVFKSHMKYLYKDDEKIALLEKQRAAEAAANPQPEGGAEGADQGQDQDHEQD